MPARFATCLALLLLFSSLRAGGQSAPPRSRQRAATPPFSPTRITAFYEAEPAAVTPAAVQYPLPVDTAAVANWNRVSARFDLSRIHPLIKQNGFGVLSGWKPDKPEDREDMVAPYRMLKELGIPVFVTADTLLHLYHVQFDETLREIEEREFYPALTVFTRALLDDSRAQESEQQGLAAEAARRNTTYFAVALKLLDPAATPAGGDAAVRDRELGLIQSHDGYTFSPLFTYREDYSQYVPRGHYTRSETLQRYFRAMMWFGRMGFLLRNSELLAPPNAEIQTLGACLIAGALARVRAGESTAAGVWDRIYAVTSFYVGLADDLTPYEYVRAMQAVTGSAAGVAALADTTRFHALRAYLAGLRNPQIYGGTGECLIGAPFNPPQIDECLAKSKGMRLLGQRFVPDSYIFQNLVGMDYTGHGEPFTLVRTLFGPVRGFPRGLDVMDLLGSTRAREILAAEGDTEYELYAEERRKLEVEFGAFTAHDWNRNLYWGWLYALKTLLGPYGPGYPTFMRTQAWTDRSLNAALASWTELRHDTILYAKQSYTPGRSSLPPRMEGWVEPVPEFYGRLLALTRMTTRGLAELRALSDPARARLDKLAALLERLLAVSIKELKGELLSSEEVDYVNGIGVTLEQTVMGVDNTGVRTTLAADVHTDGNSAQVLEEGVGYLDLIAVVVPQSDGALRVAMGPVFSYYEFKWPSSDRLTDESWRTMLAARPPARPPWTESFVR